MIDHPTSPRNDHAAGLSGPHAVPLLTRRQRRLIDAFPTVLADLRRALETPATSERIGSSTLWQLVHQLILAADYFGFVRVTRSARALQSALRARARSSISDAILWKAALREPLSDLIDQLEILAACATLAERTGQPGSGSVAVEDRRLVYALAADADAIGRLTRHLEARGWCLIPYGALAVLEIAVATKPPAALLIHDTQPERLPTLRRLREFLGPETPIVHLGWSGIDSGQLQLRHAGASACFPGDVSGTSLIRCLSTQLGLEQERAGGVLLVCDRPARARELDAAIRSVELGVRTETDPDRILQCVADGECELLLLDAGSADWDVLELGATVRQSAEGALMPLVYIGAAESLGRQLQSVGLGSDDRFSSAVEPGALAHLIRARIDAARDLRRLISVDTVTGLPNRRAFEHQFEQLMGVMDRNRAPMAVAVVEVDELDSINRTHGFHVGDEVLRALAEELRRRLRYSDLTCRYDRARFVLALPDTGLFAASILMERFKKRMDGRGPVPTQGGPRVSISVGVSACRFSARGGEAPLHAGQLVESAHQALRLALNAGGDCVRVDNQRAA